MLESAADPFGEVSEDNFNDDGSSRQADEMIGKFLSDLRDMDVMQDH